MNRILAQTPFERSPFRHEMRQRQRDRQRVLNTRDLIPGCDRPLDLESEERLHHLDIPSLSADQIFAEQVLVTQAFAERVFYRVPERTLNGGPLTDRDWLRERLRRLRAAAYTRKGVAA